MNDTTKVVVIKRYTTANEAAIDAGLLKSNGIECAIDGSSISNILPYLQNSVSLVIKASDIDQATSLIPDCQIEEDV